MPLKHFIADNKSIAKAFIDYIEYIYGGNCMIDDQDEEGVHLSMNVPGDLKREDFENDVQDFCEEHNCTFELVNQAPNAPSPQFFSENMKLMYPRVKNYEALAKDPRKLEKAKVLFKQSWNQEFNEEDEDDKEDIVLLWNEYMEELSEWKPVEVKLHYNQNLKQDSEGSHKYAIILNGEWYTTVDSYEKAMEQQEKLQSTDDEDFIREYGEFPTVEIRELKDSVKDAPVYQMTGKLVNALNHRDVKSYKNFPDVMGSKEEVSQKCKEYQDIWNTGRTDENIWILTPVLVGSENR